MTEFYPAVTVIIISNRRARICKRLRRPGIDSEDSIPPDYVAWRAGTTKRVVVPARQAGNRFLGSLKDLQIRAQGSVSQKSFRKIYGIIKWKTEGGQDRKFLLSGFFHFLFVQKSD
jgi:hypothetical protein